MNSKKQNALLAQIADLVDSAAKDAGWGRLDQKPYPSDPKLRNCESVGAFVGSLRRGVRDIIGAVGALLSEGKAEAEKRADMSDNLRIAQVAALERQAIFEHDASDLKEVEAS